MLLAIGLAVGLVLTVGYFFLTIAVWWSPGPFSWFDAWDEIEVTYVNETDEQLVVYLDDEVIASVLPGESVTHSYRKLEWWFNRSVSARTSSGRIVYATEADEGDLDDLGYRIVIEP